MEDQRVMVIQDASKQVCSSAIKWALHTLILKPGDLLLLLGVLHQVNHPTPVVSLKGTRKLMGYRKRMGFSSKFAANHTIVDRETRKEEIEVTSGASPAVVAMQSAQNMKATWVILDRKMKKNKKIFLEKLPCGISRMKKNNGIKLLRGPRTKFCLTYDDMIPGNPEEDDLFSIELFPTCKTIFDKPQLNQYQRLENKQNVVIKPAKNNIFFQEPLKFKSEIDELIRVRHKNLVMLLGDCPEGTHRLLVYEYVCNDSLDQHLSSKDNHMKKKTILVQEKL
ncbi:putative receptor-like protein kinase [Gossypium australe]|uniref:non-specific serine/threonine protein kinase n=1 Tax=Gossypium australe TaxID=47621 RepID=A0A5B6UZ48_9ROSI|nr:putative receptor-like protein kinase [Gossypium australe]